MQPTRDLVPDNLKSDATKSGLADRLDEDVRIKLTRAQYNSLMKRYAKGHRISAKSGHCVILIIFRPVALISE
jgi:hypothetical protein